MKEVIYMEQQLIYNKFFEDIIMSSNSQKSKALNKVYRALNKVDKSATIKRDPLHSRYLVNKYSITIQFSNKNKYSVFKEDYISQLISDLHLAEIENSYKSFSSFTNKEQDFNVVIRDLRQLNNNIMLLSVSVY